MVANFLHYLIVNNGTTQDFEKKDVHSASQLPNLVVVQIVSFQIFKKNFVLLF